jgi:DNA-directed RNA polymerase subunit beta
MPVTILLKAIGMTFRADPLATFFEFDNSTFPRRARQFELVPERLRGEVAKFDITDKGGKLIVAKDKRITVKHIRDMEEAGIKKIDVPEEFICLAVSLAQNIIDPSKPERSWPVANDEITEESACQTRKPASIQSEDALHQ